MAHIILASHGPQNPKLGEIWTFLEIGQFLGRDTKSAVSTTISGSSNVTKSTSIVKKVLINLFRFLHVLISFGHKLRKESTLFFVNLVKLTSMFRDGVPDHPLCVHRSSSSIPHFRKPLLPFNSLVSIRVPTSSWRASLSGKAIVSNFKLFCCWVFVANTLYMSVFLD